MKSTLKTYLRASAKAVYKNPLGLIGAWVRYWTSYRAIKAARPESMGFRLTPSSPSLMDHIGSSGAFGRYVYQDSWAFRHVLDARPATLVDVASSTYFVAFSAQVTNVISVDIRPLSGTMPSLVAMEGDVTELPFADGSIEAISTLSVIEHIGLGRYGDRVDLGGMQRAIHDMLRVLRPGGMLLVSFPVGAENVIRFNAHRVVTPEKVLELFSRFTLEDEKYALRDRLVDRDRFDTLGRPYSYGCYRFSR